MAITLVAGTRAVVFVSTRNGSALKRREQCLELAGLAYALESERRPSGTYFKLCVAERDAVDAYAVLALGGCRRTTRRAEPADPMTESLTQVASMLRDEAGIAAEKVVTALRVAAPKVAPRILATLRAATANRG